MDSGDSRAAARSGMRKHAANKGRGPKFAGNRGAGRSAGELKLYTEDAPGI